MSIPNIVMDFIENLGNFKKYYKDPLFSISILRMVDSKTKAVLFDLLTTNIHINTMKVIPNIKESLNVLLRLNLIKKVEDHVFLEEDFRNALLQAFCNPDFNIKLIKTTTSPINNEKLSLVCEEKLRTILEFIASDSEKYKIKINKDILFYSDLINSNQQITNKGFEFLLLTHSDQLWFLIINSIKHYSKDKSEEIQLFLILLEILIKRDSGPYTSKEFLSWYIFLDSIGVIFIMDKTEDSIVFCVYSSLLQGNNRLKDPLSKKFIILETNFKIYAYTCKSYEKSVLSLFSRNVCAFPNLIKAEFNEESLQIAFEKGITAKQIIKYLREYSECVPRNVENQINIWEQKQHRIRLRNGYLYHDFVHLSDFYKVLKFIETRGSVIFKDEQKRVIVGEERSHEEVKAFIKELNG